MFRRDSPIRSSPGRLAGRLAVVCTALNLAGLLVIGGIAEAAPSYDEVNFRVQSLSPKFGPNIHDYVVRCHDQPVTVNVHASGGWEVAVGSHPFESGDFSEGVGVAAGREFVVLVQSQDGRQRYRYHVRCLPDDFPTYTFTRNGPVSPKYFSVDQAFFYPLEKRYAIIFDNHGAPIWWYQNPARDVRVLPSGDVLWFNFYGYQWEVHRLDGSLVRRFDPVGATADPHDLQFLANGDYLAGAEVVQSHVNTSSYGGSSDADVVNAELQEVTPDGQLAWDWKSQDQISLGETGRFWPWAIHHGYDILHWNSIAPDGASVIASFRHLDAVYKIRKATGQIVWKLGGTKTAKSLTVLDDPVRYTLGAQHDARLLPDGTLTVFDNRTNLGNHRPRAVRYRIDQKDRTATLVRSISDPAVSQSACCGSARRLDNGDWLIDWGLPNGIGGYEPGGKRDFFLNFDSTFSYRAEPVPAGVVSARDLRQAMNAIYAQSG